MTALLWTLSIVVLGAAVVGSVAFLRIEHLQQRAEIDELLARFELLRADEIVAGLPTDDEGLAQLQELAATAGLVQQAVEEQRARFARNLVSAGQAESVDEVLALLSESAAIEAATAGLLRRIENDVVDLARMSCRGTFLAKGCHCRYPEEG